MLVRSLSPGRFRAPLVVAAALVLLCVAPAAHASSASAGGGIHVDPAEGGTLDLTGAGLGQEARNLVEQVVGQVQGMLPEGLDLVASIARYEPGMNVRAMIDPA